VRLPTPLCRLAYRGAYLGLRGYWFVRRPEVHGVKCVLTNGEHVLLVRHTYGHRDWDLPGGSIKSGEAPMHAARREMEEELGVAIDNWVSLGRFSDIVDHRRDNMNCFQAEVGPAELNIDECELAAVSWFPRAQLPPDIGPYVRRILARGPG
jgi:8-oxo-dGTP pyrophosphatase MutT (NUDIX family)